MHDHLCSNGMTVATGEILSATSLPQVLDRSARQLASELGCVPDQRDHHPRGSPQRSSKVQDRRVTRPCKSLSGNL